MIDGRPINQDYYGYVAWDFVPIQPRRDQADRGAQRGGLRRLGRLRHERRRQHPDQVAARDGRHDRHVGRRDLRPAGRTRPSPTPVSLYYVNATHAQAINDRWAYKASAGYYQTDPLRPADRHDPQRLQDALPAVRELRDEAAEGRRARRLRLAGWHAARLVLGRVRRHRRDVPHGPGPVPPARTAPRLVRQGRLPARRPLGQELRQSLERRGHQPPERRARWGSRCSWTSTTRAGTSTSRRPRRSPAGTRLTYGGNYRHNWTSITMAPLAREAGPGRRLHSGRDPPVRPFPLARRRSHRQVQHPEEPGLLAAHRAAGEADARARPSGCRTAGPTAPRPCSRTTWTRRSRTG